MTLLEALLILGDAARSPQGRCRAGEALDGHVRAIVQGLARVWNSSDAREEVAQETAAKALRGAPRFRGTTEGEAYVWMKTIATNAKRDIERKARRQGQVVLRLREQPAGGYRPPGSPVFQQREATTDATEADPEHEAERGRASRAIGPLRTLLERLPKVSARLHPRGAVLAGRQALCFLEYALGRVRAADQIRAFAEEVGIPVETPAEWEKARNRIYTYRLRGRSIVCEALVAVEMEAGADRAAISVLRRLLDLDRSDDDEGGGGGAEPS